MTINKKSKNELETNTENKNNKVNKKNIVKITNRTPPVGEISVGEFIIPPRGYLEIEGPNVTLNIQDGDALEIIKFLAKLGNYGFLYIDNNSSDEENSLNIKPNKISATFKNQEYSKVLNSLLMASNHKLS